MLKNDYHTALIRKSESDEPQLFFSDISNIFLVSGHCWSHKSCTGSQCLISGIDQTRRTNKCPKHQLSHRTLWRLSSTSGENGASQWWTVTSYKEQNVLAKLMKEQEEYLAGRLPRVLTQHYRSCRNVWQALVTPVVWQQSVVVFTCPDYGESYIKVLSHELNIQGYLNFANPCWKMCYGLMKSY